MVKGFCRSLSREATWVPRPLILEESLGLQQITRVRWSAKPPTPRQVGQIRTARVNERVYVALRSYSNDEYDECISLIIYTIAHAYL